MDVDLESLPDEIWLCILRWLDPGVDSCAASLTCARWRSLVGSQAWARAVFGRHFGEFVDAMPMERGEGGARVFLQRDHEERHAEMGARYARAVEDGDYAWLLRHHWPLRHLRFGGVWKGHYGPHGWEFLHVMQRGFVMWAVKLTGDPNVPAGAETFRLTLDCEFRLGAGRIQLADHGFRDPRFGVANCWVMAEDKMTVFWLFDPEDPESFIIPTEMFRCRTPVHVVVRILESMEKDQWGNVDARRLEIE